VKESREAVLEKGATGPAMAKKVKIGWVVAQSTRKTAVP
jgi:hypothetical protein